MRPKRLISLLVAVCMMITMLPLSAVTAFAEDTSSSPDPEEIVGDYKYAYEVNADGNATITEFLGPVDPTKAPALYDITIPTTLGGCTVTGLGDYSFAAKSDDGSTYDPLCSNIHSVTIPQKVTSIGKRAFYDCKNLTTLVLGEDIQTIGNYAFECCTSLTGVTIPQSVTSIGYSAFEGCTNLNPLTIKGPITSMGNYAFAGSTYLTSLTLYDDIQTIGNFAFVGSTSLKTVTLPKNLTSIGEYAFARCSELESITIPEKVKTINPKTFADCSKLEYIILPAGLTTFDDSLENCRPECVIYYKDYKTAADALRDNNVVLQNDILAGHNFLYLCKVTFDANGGDLTGKGGNLTNYLTDNLTDHAEVPVYKTEKITATMANDLKETDLDAINDPKRAGYKFTGWYTKDGKRFYVKDTAITDDITLHARWEFDPNALVCHPLTLKDGVITSVTVPGKDGADPEDITEIVKKNANEDGSFNVPEGATVSVAFDKDAFADSGLKFGHWDITGLDDPNAYQDKESFDFEMPAKAVTLKAMTQDASIEDDEPDIVGPIVIGTTVVVGGAVLGYQAYSLGAEFAGKLMALPYFPSNRSALAMMLWEDAGKPMPESELLYPDVGQEERDMDLQHAARWAMENELIPDLNDEGTAPEEMKFFPANPVSKLDVLNAWQKAQELKNN